MKNLMQWFSADPSSASVDHKFCVAAVVDKIPAPSDIVGSSFDVGAPHHHDLGHEGIGLLFLNQTAVFARINSFHSSGNRFDNESNSKPALVFSTSSQSASKGRGMGLQIANTLFQNGRLCTLVASHWESQPRSEHEAPLPPTLLCQKEISNCSIDIDIQAASHPAPGLNQARFTIPLLPITQPRRVSSCMGNILRGLEGDQESTRRESSRGRHNHTKSQLPASSELEREIPRFIAANQLDNRPIAVWALVGNSLADLDIGNATGGIACSLEKKGVRLYRVLSGGGGWGPKTGLLSLDPDCPSKLRDEEESSIQNLFQHDQESNEFNFDKPLNAETEAFKSGDDILKLFQATSTDDNQSSANIHPGQYVQFLVASLDSSTTLARQEKTTTDYGSANTAFAVEIGVIPQSEDFDPAHTADSPSDLADVGEIVETDKSASTVVPVPNFFGALSGKSMIYSSSVRLCSKIDVPGSLWSWSRPFTKE